MGAEKYMSERYQKCLVVLHWAVMRRGVFIFFQCAHLVDVVQFGTWPSAVVGLLTQPLGANFDPAAARLAAA